LYKPAVLFLFGILLGFIIMEIEAYSVADHPEDSLGFLLFSLTRGGYFAGVMYYVLLIIILPFVAIPQLKKKLTPKSFHVYSFVCGITFWGAVNGFYILLAKFLYP